MSKKGLLLIPVVAVLLLAQNCGHDQQLTSITVQPATQTFGDPNTPVSADAGLSVQLSAMGTYIHPPVTKDITDQVTWTSNTPGMVTVTPKGLITPTGTSCGTTVVSATVTTNHSSGNISSSGALVTGSMTANVVCYTGTTAPVLEVSFTGGGSGTVTSNPPGLDCTSACGNAFLPDIAVTLTATPKAPSTSAEWTAGCDTVVGQTCTINDLSADRVVTVFFK
ncbi:MAG TPA: hypothetical protein VFA89_24090 [Terriglobales bacterium]|nr:hypothetical protein [Terriglobales bacterium]